MTETPDCHRARTLVQRAVTGVDVGEEELEWAREHLAGCELCAERIEEARSPACEEVKEDLPDAARLLREGEDLASHYPDLARHLEECEWCRATLAELVKEPDVFSETEIEVEPGERYERYMADALADGGSEPIVRRRAADWLGRAERVGPVALAALADAVAEDADGKVRRAALMALDRLDEEVSLPRRIIEAWSAAPAEAVQFISGVLARLTAEGPPVSPGVIGLVGSASPGGEETTLSGPEGASGLLRGRQSELWLTLERLPSGFENTKPVIALPKALAEIALPIRWSGEQPGLVPAARPVANGFLEVRLGHVVAEPETERLFDQVYLLNPSAHLGSAG
jgi:hypothetical protein